MRVCKTLRVLEQRIRSGEGLRHRVDLLLITQHGALPAAFAMPAWGTVVAGMSDLAWATGPAVQHFCMRSKSSVPS